MNKLANQLIKIGESNPELRKHLRPILDKIALGGSRRTPSGTVDAELFDAWCDDFLAKLNSQSKRRFSVEERVSGFALSLVSKIRGGSLQILVREHYKDPKYVEIFVKRVHRIMPQSRLCGEAAIDQGVDFIVAHTLKCLGEFMDKADAHVEIQKRLAEAEDLMLLGEEERALDMVKSCYVLANEVRSQDLTNIVRKADSRIRKLT